MSPPPLKGLSDRLIQGLDSKSFYSYIDSVVIVASIEQASLRGTKFVLQPASSRTRRRRVWRSILIFYREVVALKVDPHGAYAPQGDEN